MERMGMVTGILPEKIPEYEDLHRNVWPQILERLSQSHIRNYSIFLFKPQNLLFSYWEYHGTDFEKDMRAVSTDPMTQKWWALTDPCQKPFKINDEKKQWSDMTEVFHME